MVAAWFGIDAGAWVMAAFLAYCTAVMAGGAFLERRRRLHDEARKAVTLPYDWQTDGI